MAKRIEPVDRLVGSNIRIFRTAKGMSQTALGDSLGVTFQQIQKYEKGVNRVGSSRLQKIAEVLDVPVNRLFDNAITHLEKPVPNQVVTDLLALPYSVQLLKAFARLPNDRLRRTLAHLAESIAESTKR